MSTAVPQTPGPAPAAPPNTPARPAKRPNNLVGTAVLVAFAAAGSGLAHGGPAKLLTFAFVMLGWTLSVMAHEFAHALTAYLGGDVTVRAKGYLSFDPRRYGDLGTSLVMPLIFLALGGIGFPGGAVYLRMDLIRGPFWRAAAALAGPGATLATLLGLAFVLRLWTNDGAENPLFPAVAFLAFLQATALILNLLPIPGLDGFGAIRPFLPERWASGLRKYEGLAMVALFVLLFVTPVGGGLLFRAGATVAANLGVPLDAIRVGYDNFHFWR